MGTETARAAGAPLQCRCTSDLARWPLLPAPASKQRPGDLDDDCSSSATFKP